MKQLIFTLVLISGYSVPAVAAGDGYKPLNSAQLTALLSGNTIKGEYRFMRARTKTYSFTETHMNDGTTRYKEGQIKANGVWYTLGERKVCYRYPNSVEMSGTSCFWVYNDDGCYYGYGLDAMTLKGPRSFDDWGARWVVQSNGGSCDAPIS